MAVEEIEDEGGGGWGIEARAAVAGAGDDVESGFDAGFREGGLEFPALLDGDEGVAIAVEDEERGGGFGHVIEGAGGTRLLLMGGDGATEELGHGGIGGIQGAGRLAVAKEIGGAEEIDDALDGAGLAEIWAGVEVCGLAGDAEEGDEVAAGGGAPDADAAGIDAILGGVGAEPADGGFAILDLGGKGGILAKAVLDAGGGVAKGEEAAGGALAL